MPDFYQHDLTTIHDLQTGTLDGLESMLERRQKIIPLDKFSGHCRYACGTFGQIVDQLVAYYIDTIVVTLCGSRGRITPTVSKIQPGMS